MPELFLKLDDNEPDSASVIGGGGERIACPGAQKVHHVDDPASNNIFRE